MPPEKLPDKPLASKLPCHDLTEIERQACLDQGLGARRVCMKVQRNKMLCDGSQDFIDRLYSERDGK